MPHKKLKIDIRNCDYRQLLESLPAKSVDLICIDPPYGKINGMKLSGQKRKIDWDETINWSEMFHHFNRVIKDGGTIVCFGQQPTYSQMILANLKDFKYEMIWEKNNAAQGFHADKMPLCFSENIAIFIHNESKTSKRTFNNIAKAKQIDPQSEFCRWYAKYLFDNIGLTRRKIHEIMTHRKLEFFFYYTGKNFTICSESLYNDLITHFKIDQFEHFVDYSFLKQKWSQEKNQLSQVDVDSFRTKTINILKVPKEKEYFHPTQKPIELMEKLILMFSNENDVVLDCFMGSGSTGVAAIKNNRNFIGSELSPEYFEISKKRINKID